MPSLYQIAEELLPVLQQLEEMDLDPETFQDTLDSLTAPLETKAENIIKYMKSLEALAAAKKEEAKRLSESAAQDLKKAEWLKGYLADNLQKTGVKNLQAGVFALSFRKGSEVVEIDDSDKDTLFANLSYMQAHHDLKILTPQDPKISKTELKKLLQKGVPIKGVSLVRKPDTLQVK